MATNFKLTLSLKKRPKDEAVYFKQDGQRFSQPRTVKLNVNAAYSVQISIQPPRILERVIIQGDAIQPKMFEQTAQKHLYLMEWTTEAIDLSQAAKRLDITFIFEFQEMVTMKATLQCKFYKEKESNHSHWGQQLHGVKYMCRIPEGSTYVEIMEDIYL